MEKFVVTYLFEIGVTFFILVGLLAILIKDRKNSESSQECFPAIDLLNCIGCNLCIKKCLTGALGFSEKKAILQESHKCIGCGACALSCKKNAIEMIAWSELEIKNKKKIKKRSPEVRL